MQMTAGTARVVLSATDAMTPDFLVVKVPFADKDLVKAIPGRKWVPYKGRKGGQWEIPLESITEFRRLFPQGHIAPDAATRVQDYEGRIKAKLQAKVVMTDLTVPGLKGTLYPFQQQGVSFLDQMAQGEGAILAFDMGLGKSLSSIAYALRKFEQKQAKYCLIVCPAPLKFATWEAEIRKWTDEEYIIVDGSKVEEVEEEDGTVSKLQDRELREVQYLQYLNGVRFIVMNYELFLHDAPEETSENWIRERAVKKKVKKGQESERNCYDVLKQMFLAQYTVENANAEESLTEEQLLQKARESASQQMAKATYGVDAETNWDIRENSKGEPYWYRRIVIKDIIPELNKDWIVVLDEAHRIKNPKAQTTKNMLRKIKGAGYKVLGTGTPLENNIEELWQLVDLCKPGLLGNNWQFKKRYIEEDNWGFTGRAIQERLPELRERIAPLIFRKTKKEALPDLPELIPIDRWVDMTKDQEALYKEVREGVLETADDVKYLDVLAQLTRFQQICDSPALLSEYLGREIAEESGKLVELPFILSEIRPDENKVILFTQYETMSRILVRKLQEWYPQFKTVFVTGKVTDDRKRAEVVNAFQTDDNTRFMVMTTAGNYGLNLQAATYVIAFDETFNPQKMNQVYSRAHRNGQKNAVTAINLKTRDTYEERKTSILSSKRAIFADMIDGETPDEDVLKLIENWKELI